MAEIKVDGKLYEGTQFKMLSYNGKIEIALFDRTLEFKQFSFDNKRPVKVFVQGNINRLKVDSTTIVKGNISRARIANDLYVKGTITQVQNALTSMIKKQDLKMCFPDTSKPLNNGKARVITIMGDLDGLITSTPQGCFIYDITGNVTYLECSASVYVTGDIGGADVGNAIYSKFSFQENEEQKILMDARRREAQKAQDKWMEDMDKAITKTILETRDIVYGKK